MKFIYNGPALLHEDALIIGDTHFGLETKLRSKGIYDNGFSMRLFENIRDLVLEYKVKKIILAGDVKENILFLDRTTEQILEKISQLAELIIVRGNHDGGIERFKGAKIISSEGFVYEGLGIFHGHTWPAEELMNCKYLISGHQHPKILMTDRLGKNHSEPVWVLADLDAEKAAQHYKKFNPKIKLILLPAFNPLLGKIFNRTSQVHLGPILNKKIFKLLSALVFRLDGTNLGMLKNIQTNKLFGKKV